MASDSLRSGVARASCSVPARSPRIEGYSESLDHELRTRGIRVSVVEPANTSTQFDANLLEPDAKLDAYTEARAAMAKRMSEMLATGDQPGVVADTVLR